jgi:hypothetical protein
MNQNFKDRCVPKLNLRARKAIAAFVMALFGVAPFTSATSFQFINLGGLPGSTESTAIAVNNLGDIVGYSFFSGDTSAYRPTLWRNGNVFDLSLSTLTDGAYGEAINDNGKLSSRRWGTPHRQCSPPSIRACTF